MFTITRNAVFAVTANAPVSVVPDAVRKLAHDIGLTTNADVFVADHEHEELSEGAWSIACEGNGFDAPTYANMLTGPNRIAGWHVEALSSWCLALYPQA